MYFIYLHILLGLHTPPFFIYLKYLTDPRSKASRTNITQAISNSFHRTGYAQLLIASTVMWH